MIMLRLEGKAGSGINHIINGQGTAVISTQASRMN
jgi:hypothetical protein